MIYLFSITLFDITFNLLEFDYSYNGMEIRFSHVIWLLMISISMFLVHTIIKNRIELVVSLSYIEAVRHIATVILYLIDWPRFDRCPISSEGAVTILTATSVP